MASEKGIEEYDRGFLNGWKACEKALKKSKNKLKNKVDDDQPTIPD